MGLAYVEDQWGQVGKVGASSDEWEEIRKNWMKEGEALLAREAQRQRDLGVENVETELRQGRVAEEVVAVADERKAELIVLASHQASPLGRLLMGSRTFEIFQRAACPILRVVR